MLHYKGRMAVKGTAFTGTGEFLVAPVDGDGTVHWNHHARAMTPAGVVGKIP